MAATYHQRHNFQIAIWLLVCCGLIFTMILLGGYTRLTQSGLSMVDWKPIMGIIPPFTDGQWMEAFQQYKKFPEFRWVNATITLQEFRSIFLVEYAHRVLGRIIGAAFLLPLIYFLLAGKLKGPLRLKLFIVFILGGLQGLLGWYMVQSGLVDDPHVSQYRLTAHLGAAVVLYGYILWVALGLIQKIETGPALTSKLQFPQERTGATSIRWLKIALPLLPALIFLMILSGGFVAGTKAGFTINTFPTMNGQWIPDGLLALTPIWRNFFENIITIQFAHRCLAVFVVAAIMVVWSCVISLTSNHNIIYIAHLLLLALGVQVTLGITTLLYVVPIPLAVAHQGGAIVLLSVAILLNRYYVQ